MKQALLFATAFLLFFSCVETDYVNDRVDPEIFISNPLSNLEEGTNHQFEVRYFNYVGKEIGLSNWMTIVQEDINNFAKLTRDEQWIHVDPERCAKYSPYKKPIIKVKYRNKPNKL